MPFSSWIGTWNSRQNVSCYQQSKCFWMASLSSFHKCSKLYTVYAGVRGKHLYKIIYPKFPKKKVYFWAIIFLLHDPLDGSGGRYRVTKNGRWEARWLAGGLHQKGNFTYCIFTANTYSPFTMSLSWQHSQCLVHAYDISNWLRAQEQLEQLQSSLSYEEPCSCNDCWAT